MKPRRALRRGNKGQYDGARRSERARLLAACERLLKVEREVAAMDDQWAREWFMSKPGHQDCFRVAKALQEFLTREWD